MFRRKQSRGSPVAVELCVFGVLSACGVIQLWFGFYERAQPTARSRRPCPIYVSTTAGRMPFVYLVGHTLFAVVCVQTSRIHLVRRAAVHWLCTVCRRPRSLIMTAIRARLPQARDPQKRVSLVQYVGLVSAQTVSSGSRSPCCSGCVGVFLMRRGFLYFEVLGMYHNALPQSPLYF